MVYLESLYTLMKGPGLVQQLEEIYGANIVKRVMTGMAISRALRVNVLVGCALTVKLQK